MVMGIVLSSFADGAIDIWSEKQMSHLEYAGDVLLMNQDPHALQVSLWFVW